MIVHVLTERVYSQTAKGLALTEQILQKVDETTLRRQLIPNWVQSGYLKAEVRAIFEEKDGKFNEIEATELKKELQQLIDNSINEVEEVKADPVAELQKERKARQDLEKRLEALENANKGNDDVLESLRKEYFDLSGKKPNHLMKEKGLIKAINELKNK